MAVSVNIPIYDDTAPVLPISQSTPFGYYDNDPIFQATGPKFVLYAARKLGWPIVNIELQYVNFYQCFEEAVNTYGKELYEYMIRENMISFQGGSTETNLNNAVITPSLGTVIRIADTYGSEAGVGGHTNYFTGSLPLQALQQYYDLNYYASASWGVTGSIEVKRVYFEQPPAIVRFFDPYAGTGTGLQSLMETFGFGQFSPGINFMLMPVNFDVLTIQAIEFNDQIRRSNFSFNIKDNKLRIFPMPTMNQNLWIDYILVADRDNSIYLNSTSSVSNVSNVPYTNPTFSTLNGPAIQWIFQYAAALCEEVLGKIREKYATVPIPDVEIPLDGAALITAAQTDKQNLIQQLRDTLNYSSRNNQLLLQSQQSQYLKDTLGGVPMPIYIG